MKLQAKVALVTGASRGVGAATAVALAAAGARVACAARSTAAHPQPLPGTLDDVVARIADAGGDAVAVPTNLADPDAVTAMVRSAEAHYGRVDVLVNNAAITFPGDLTMDAKRWDLVFAVDARAPFLATAAVAPGMRSRGEGVIVNVSSLAALNAFPGLMAYGAAKAALEHLTVTSAAALTPDVRVNGFRIDVPVASEGFLAGMPDADHSDWEPAEVAAEGIVWLTRQEFTGRNCSMAALREEHGIMASRAERPHRRSAAMVTETTLQLP